MWLEPSSHTSQKPRCMRRPGSVAVAPPASSLSASVATVGAFPNRGLSPGVSRPHCQLKPPSISLRNPPATVSGPRSCATRFVDSKGHSRFVLRILIILSHRSPQTRARRIAVHVVGTVIAHIAKTAMYAPPGIGRVSASSLEAADETREGRKGPPLPVNRGLPLFQPSTTQLAE